MICNTFISFIWSNPDVISSNNKIGQSFIKHLAIDNLCFYPPDNLLPYSPIIVSNPYGRLLMKSYRFNFLQILSISLIDAYSLPCRILLIILSLNIY